MAAVDTLGAWLEGLVPPSGLSPAQRRVADTIGKNQQLASFADIAEIAERSMVNNSTVVRCAQSLGFRGWPDLKQDLRSRFLAGLSTEETLSEHAADPRSAVHDAVKHDIANLRRTLETNTPEEIDLVMSALASARQILVTGMGSFSAPATVMAHLGSTMGYPISLENRGGVHLATALNGMGPGDVLMVINMWRPMRDLVTAAESAKDAGVTVIALTDMRRGRPAQLADYSLIVPSEGVSFFQSVTAATSVVYGLLSGMEAAHPERSRTAIRRTQQLWQDIGTYVD